MEKFYTTVEAARKWGVSPSLVLKLAKSGRIAGVTQIGTRWMIPQDAKKPLDARTKAAKEDARQDFFRYPAFEYRDECSFSPPLSAEELQIKNALQEFYACDFHKADFLLGNLPEAAQNRYIRITALYGGCMTDIFLCNTERFFDRYGRLCSELQKDFPHKKEMEQYIHEINAILGDNKYYAKDFKISPDYAYHKSFLPHLANLSAVSLVNPDNIHSVSDLRSHELNCIFLEEGECYSDLQALHISLGSAYAMLKQKNEMMYHYRKALELAEKYNLYFIPAIQFFYMRKAFSSVTGNFSEDFVKRLTFLSDDIHSRYQRFTDEISVTSIYKLLGQKDYIYLYAAVQGYSGKEVARILHMSESAVSKHYSEIYDMLGIGGKAELIKLFHSHEGNNDALHQS